MVSNTASVAEPLSFGRSFLVLRPNQTGHLSAIGAPIIDQTVAKIQHLHGFTDSLMIFES